VPRKSAIAVGGTPVQKTPSAATCTPQ